MKRVLLLAISCLFHFLASAQGEGNVWAFGTSAGMDFNNATPVAIATAITGYGEASASICDQNGQLLFYSEGTHIWDKNGNVMPNASDLTGLPYIINLYAPTSSTAQGVVIVPMPDSAGKYYVFSLSSQFQEMGLNAGKLYYSIVNMNLNGGLGDVEPGRKGILIDSLLTEKMTAVVGDRCNVWLLVHKTNSTLFKAYEITPAGLNLVPVISNTGSMTTLYTSGTMNASHNRKKLACANTYTVLFTALGGLELFDFDPATGVVSNGETLEQIACYGTCFSPNDSLLYVSRYNTDIYQYNVSLNTATAITASGKYLGQTSFTHLKSAPDGKIYLGGTTSPFAITQLSTILSPNSHGLSCQLTQDNVPLASNTSFFAGLPSGLAIFRRDTIKRVIPVKVCFKDSVELIADTAYAGWDHQWDDGATNTHKWVHQSGDYVISYHAAPCVFHSDTFRVDFASPIPYTGTFAGCKGDSNSFIWIQPRTGDTNTYYYSWKDSTGNMLQTDTTTHGDTLFTQEGIYTVYILGRNGCDTTIRIRLSLPDYHASFVTDSIICIGDTLQLLNTSQGFMEYIWDLGNGDTSHAISPDYVYPSPGTYIVTLTGMPCHDTARSAVTVDSIYQVAFTTSDTALCAGKAFSFFADTPASMSMLHWDFGDGTFLDHWSPTHAYDSSGSWSVTVTASYRACPYNTFTTTLHTYPYPVAALGKDTFMCPNSQPILLASQQQYPLSYSYRWNTGDTAGTIYIRHPAVYALTVTSDKGCSSSDSVEVFKDCYIDIPNAFTPNGDGDNDYFLPRQLLSKSLTAFHMQVFNRWGQMVFETMQTNGRGWDGGFNGRAQPAGVYVYLIEATIDNQHAEKYQGNVTLLR